MENCGDKLSTFWIIGFRSKKLQAMSKAFYLPEIFERFIKYEDIPATSHTPQLLASNCFLSEKRDSRVGFEIPNSIFAI